MELVQFDQNEAAFRYRGCGERVSCHIVHVLCISLAVCTFASRSDTEWYVVVGTAKDLSLSPRACSGGSLILFKFSPDATKLEHVHTVS